jgi:hypothetical protein
MDRCLRLVSSACCAGHHAVGAVSQGRIADACTALRRGDTVPVAGAGETIRPRTRLEPVLRRTTAQGISPGTPRVQRGHRHAAARHAAALSPEARHALVAPTRRLAPRSLTGALDYGWIVGPRDPGAGSQPSGGNRRCPRGSGAPELPPRRVTADHVRLGDALPAEALDRFHRAGGAAEIEIPSRRHPEPALQRAETVTRDAAIHPQDGVPRGVTRQVHGETARRKTRGAEIHAEIPHAVEPPSASAEIEIHHREIR